VAAKSLTLKHISRVKLHHLLQKCSFFLIKLAAVQASGAAYMKLDFKSFFSDQTGRSRPEAVLKRKT